MTLTEYLNQKEPVKMPYVELQEGEYWQGGFIGIVNRIAPLTINDLPYSYVVKEGSNHVYTTDKFGEPKTLSCFHIKIVN